MENIVIEKNKNGKFKLYGRGGTPFKCIKATLKYGTKEKDNFIPVTFGRYGDDLDFDYIQTESELEKRPDIIEYFKEKYEELRPEKVIAWKDDVQKQYTKETEDEKLFRVLFSNLNERVASKDALPGNTNPQKQVQNLRDRGLCIMTESENNTTYLRLIEGIYTCGFENEKIPKEIRKRALALYDNIDALSGKRMSDERLIIEHRFPEERWKDRPAEENVDMSDEDIKKKFQLLTGQYNQMKREACKKCAKLAQRQAPLGIAYFYEGDEEWSCDVEFGPGAEDGCVGCGWYDVAIWKAKLIEAANGKDEEDDK